MSYQLSEPSNSSQRLFSRTCSLDVFLHGCLMFLEKKFVHKQSLGQHHVLGHRGRCTLGDFPILNEEPHVTFRRALRFFQITTLLQNAWTHGTTTSVLAFTATSLGSFTLCQQSGGRQATSVGPVLAQLVRGKRCRQHSCLRKDWNSQGRRLVRVLGTRMGKI